MRDLQQLEPVDLGSVTGGMSGGADGHMGPFSWGYNWHFGGAQAQAAPPPPAQPQPRRHRSHGGGVDVTVATGAAAAPLIQSATA